MMERGHLGDPGINGRIIKIDLQEVGWEHGVDRAGSE